MIKLLKLAIVVSFIVSVGIGGLSTPTAVAQELICSEGQARCSEEAAWCDETGGEFSFYGECDECGCPYQCEWGNVEAHSWCGD